MRAGNSKEIDGDLAYLGSEPSFCQENENGLEVTYFAWPSLGSEAIIRVKWTQIVLFSKQLGKDVTAVLHNNHKKHYFEDDYFCGSESGIRESRGMNWEPVSAGWKKPGIIASCPALWWKFAFQWGCWLLSFKQGFGRMLWNVSIWKTSFLTLAQQHFVLMHNLMDQKFNLCIVYYLHTQ